MKKNLTIILGFSVFIILSYLLIRPSQNKIDQLAIKMIEEGKNYEGRYRFKEAEKCYRRVIEKYSRSAHLDEAYQLLISLLENKIYDRAGVIKECNNYLKKFSKTDFSPQALYKIGWTYLIFKGDTVNSYKYFNKFMDKYPESPLVKEVLINLSDVFNRENKYEDLIKINEEIVKKFPDEPRIDYFYITSVEAYWRSGDHKSAYETYKKIKNKSQPSVKNNIICNHLELENNPKVADKYLSLGAAYEKAGIMDKAKFYKEKAHKLKPAAKHRKKY